VVAVVVMAAATAAVDAIVATAEIAAAGTNRACA
jgi:hypothetical protein